MLTRIRILWSLAFIAVVVLGLSNSLIVAGDDDTQATEDILYMIDGRILHGQIISEEDGIVVFEFIDRNINIKTTLKIRKNEIERIDNDVPLEDASASDEEEDEDVPDVTLKSRQDDLDDEAKKSRFGLRRFESDNENATRFYIIPMSGQMGTDVNPEIYQKMEDDIRAADPDYIIIEMDCQDVGSSPLEFLPEAQEENKDERGLYAINEYREIASFFHTDLEDIPQVMWIQDSFGFSSMVALSWENMYFKPEARLAGLGQLNSMFESFGDEDIQGKMREAHMALIRGFLEHGNYSPVLADAMCRPEFALSGTWKGRQVDWSLNNRGEYIVDNSDEHTTSFTAKTAENLCLSKGTADSVEDLVLLMGVREYTIVGEKGEQIFNKYSEDWRRSYERCLDYWNEYGKFSNWASGGDALKYLGQAKKQLERILAAMNRYKAVEIRFNMQGLSKFGLEIMIEQLKEQIRALRQGQRGGGGGGGRPPGGTGSGGG